VIARVLMALEQTLCGLVLRGEAALDLANDMRLAVQSVRHQWLRRRTS
jgi:hypothetical protein